MKMIEIDGRTEAVWRCRALVAWRTAEIFPFGGAGWAEWLRTDASAPEELPKEHQLELLLTEEVLVCLTEATVTVVTSIDTARGHVTMKSGAVVAAKISRREHLAEEARVVREERMIAAMTHAEGAKVGRKQASKRMRKTKWKSNLICEVCGWGHEEVYSGRNSLSRGKWQMWLNRLNQ